MTARATALISEIETGLLAAWGDPAQEREARWPLYFRIAIMPA